MQKNVLIFGHNDAPQFIDIYNQYTGLFDPQSYRVTVIYLTSEDNAFAKARTVAEDVIFMNMPKRAIRGLKFSAIKTLYKLCRERQFEMVICHRYKPSYIMMWVASLINFRALFFVMHELGTMKSRGRQWLIKRLFQKNMYFAGVSNAVRNDLRKSLNFLPTEQVITLYNMMDTELTEPQLLSREAARASLGLAQDDFVFGNIARLVINKDHDSLFKAFATVKKQHPKAKLIILGDGIRENELKQTVYEMGLTDSIHFAGFVRNGFTYMRAFDCFVLSSTQEAFGRVLLEAMIAKRPIITTRANGIPEVMGALSYVVEKRDPDSFAAAMLQICNMEQTERDALGEQGYQHLMNNFSIPRFKKIFWNLPLVG